MFDSFSRARDATLRCAAERPLGSMFLLRRTERAPYRKAICERTFQSESIGRCEVDALRRLDQR
jgi:hypothetical protein